MLDISMLLFKIIRYGNINDILSIVMDFSDDGDLYQKIVQHQKDNTNFTEEQIWKSLIHVTIGLKKLH